MTARTLDTREHWRRLQDLESERNALVDEVYECEEAECEAPDDDTFGACVAARQKAESDLAEWREEYDDEYQELVRLRDALGECEMRDGVTLIEASSFVSYAKEYADNIGAVDSSLGWPCSCIDWEQAADELRVDFMDITYDGVDYLYRD